jgi:hypothetical protein
MAVDNAVLFCMAVDDAESVMHTSVGVPTATAFVGVQGHAAPR